MTRQPSFAIDSEKRQALQCLAEGKRFVLVGHVRPDGDCLGAQGALARGLRSLGKEVRIMNPDLPGPTFDYLQETYEAFEGSLPEHDVCVLLDINELGRCGAMAAPIAASPSKKVVIDHHPPAGAIWWDAAFLETSASATGLLVWFILKELGAPADRALAEAVFTSLVTDTGWFRYSNTDEDTLAVAAELVGLGVDSSAIFRALYQRVPASEPQALAGLLGRTEYFGEGRLAVVDQPLSEPVLRDLRDSDPVLDILRSVGDVEVVLYLKEIEPALWKLSARSKTHYDVNALARRFGGGGHRKASGATLKGDLADVRRQLIAAALEGFGPGDQAATRGVGESAG